MEYLISKDYSPETPYYFYKTTNLIDGKFYYGSGYRKGEYFGSGAYLKRAIKKYGKENFKHERLRYFKTREDAFRFEERFLQVFRLSELVESYNLKNGAHGNRIGDKFPSNQNKSWYRDSKGNLLRVATDHPKVLSGEYISNTKGKATYLDKDGNKVYTTTDDPRVLSGELVGRTKGMTCYQDRDGNKVHTTTDDPRVLSGELMGTCKGWFMVKDKDGNTFQIQKDDPRYLSGELVGVRKGTTQIQHNSIEVNVLGQTFSSKAEAMRELKVNSRTLNKLISGELKELPRNHYKRIIVDGVEYESKVDAMKKLKIGSRKLNRIMTLVK